MSQKTRRRRDCLPLIYILGLGHVGELRNMRTLRILSVYNLLFCAFMVFCLVWVTIYPNELIITRRYNYVTKITEICLTYGATLYATFIIFQFVFYKTTEYQRVLNSVRTLIRIEVPKLLKTDIAPIPIWFKFVRIFRIFVVLIGVSFAALEMYKDCRNFFAVWVLIVPNTVITIHMTLNSDVIEILVRSVNAIQRNLQSQLDEEPNLYDGVIRRLSGQTKTKIDDLVHVFKIYNDIWKLVMHYNHFFGLQYAIYTVLSICMQMSGFYGYYIGRVREFLNPDEPVVFNFIVEFWTSIYGLSMFLLASGTQRLQNASVLAASTLHKLINRQPHFRDEIIIHSLQMQHHKMIITAGSLFEINMSMMSGLSLVTITYVLVFIQIDDGFD